MNITRILNRTCARCQYLIDNPNAENREAVVFAIWKDCIAAMMGEEDGRKCDGHLPATLAEAAANAQAEKTRIDDLFATRSEKQTLSDLLEYNNDAADDHLGNDNPF